MFFSLSPSLSLSLLCRVMDSETTPIVPKKAPPMFSEPAQIQTVDTVEGLICTYEVCTHETSTLCSYMYVTIQ